MTKERDLLRRVIDAESHEMLDDILEEIEIFLAAETEAKPSGYPKKVIEALYENGDPVSIDAAELLERLTENVEPKAEPVACVNTPLSMVYPEYNRRVLGARPEPSRKPMTEDAEDEAFNSASKYAAWLETENRMLRESRKPMTEEEIDEVASRLKDARMSWGFIEGIRFAEKHHGIGINQSDPDSIDLQSRCRGDKL